MTSARRSRSNRHFGDPHPFERSRRRRLPRRLRSRAHKISMKEQSIYPISESQVLEPLGFNRLHPTTLRPRREVELSPTRSDPHLVTLHDIDPEAAAQYNRLAIGLI